ncbi:MAG: VanZ family protein [Propionicimonas sp.]|uniref:VanZ family protein n=1 Tax=Propionicimonas sp. TaxID=1955623 RepID=UPI003D12735C
MLRQFGPSTWVALLVGGLLAAVAFVPVAVLLYRRAGRLRVLDLLILLAVAVYAVALWSYTLVPLPESESFTCVRANLRLFRFIEDIRADGHLFLHNRALLQVVFNVVFFLPLGFLLRILLRRGVVVATLAGLILSLAIEFTQKTGIWGLYHCAYRVFDVDDLLLNTVGALLGSLFALPFAALIQRRRAAPVAAGVTVGRRLVGILADLAVVTVVGYSLAIGWRAFALYVLEWPLDALPGWVDGALASGVPALLEGYWVLARGRTLGEAAVQLEPLAKPGHEVRSRVLKFAFGVGGYLALSSPLVELPAAGLAFAVATLVVLVRSRNHRGLSHVVADMELVLETGPAEPGAPAPTGDA